MSKTIELSTYKNEVSFNKNAHSYNRYIANVLDAKNGVILGSIFVTPDSLGELDIEDLLTTIANEKFETETQVSVEIDGSFSDFIEEKLGGNDFRHREQAEIKSNNIRIFSGHKSHKNLFDDSVSIHLSLIDGYSIYATQKHEYEVREKELYKRFDADVMSLYNIDEKLFKYITRRASKSSGREYYMESVLSEIKEYQEAIS